MNFSIQSIPFGSSVEYTKQLNAALNSSPQGPCAIPPRHGQSQLISPVSGLNAASWPASSSSSWGDFRASEDCCCCGGGGCCCCCEAWSGWFDRDSESFWSRILGLMESSVREVAGSEGVICSRRETGGC